jgi:hypothetical protein
MGIIFISCYVIFLSLCINHIGIYTLPIAWLISEGVNTLGYASYVNRKLSLLDFKNTSIVFKTFTFVFPVIVVNIFLAHNFLHRLSFNGVFIILWIIFEWNEAINTFKFLVKKEEIK